MEESRYTFTANDYKSCMGFPLEIVALGSGYLKYDVVPICSSYRGIGRSLTPQNFRSERTKKNMDDLLEGYFQYIADLLKPVCQETFESALSYCSTLRKYDVACEVIAYDLQPLESAYGRSLTFLGIDIVHEMAESLLENGADALPKPLLNESLLCDRVSDVPQVIKLCDHGCVTWQPCWVYRVQ